MLNKITLTFLAVTALGFSAYASTHSQASNINLGEPTQAVESVADNTLSLSSGHFDGRSDHITAGQVKLEKTATGFQLSFAADFSLDGAPDPVVAIGNGETYDAANKLGKLKSKTGRQIYQLPADFVPGQFSEVYVWCEKFSVPLGVAKLTPA
jgi:hypothetical protein